MTPATNAPFSLGRLLGRGTGVGLLLAAPVTGVLCWVVLAFASDIVADPPYPPDEIPALVRGAVAWRAVMPLLAVPALACGVVLVARPGRRPLLLATLGTIALLVPFGVTLVCFIALLAPMYEYRAL